MQKYKPQFAFISDIHPNLIITYEVIRDDVEFLIQHLHIQKKNHRKDFEKFGNKKKIKIYELNKKAKKIKMYLEEWSDVPLSSRQRGEAKIELNKIIEEFKEIKKKKKEEDKQRYYYIQREIYNKNKTLSKGGQATLFHLFE